jgi:cell wall-associated NlpC family hydrolase
MAWSDKYIGAPFSPQGDGPDSFDCWGLIRFVFKEQFGIVLSRSGYDYDDEDQCQSLVTHHAHEFVKVDGPVEGALVLWHFKGTRPHVGVCVNGREMLHMTKDNGAVVVRLGTSKVRNGILGYYLPNRSAA